ncbi:aminotransferase-like domain-containing protein [Bacillus cereus]
MVNWESLYAERARSDHRDLVSGANSNAIQMAAGFPEPSLFPVQEVAYAIKKLTDREGSSVLQYNSPSGDESLRAWIADRTSTTKIQLNAEKILLTHGAQQGLDVITKVLVNPGDGVLTESPSFHGALWVFQAAGAQICSIPIDEQGIVLEKLEEKLQEMAKKNKLPKFIYTIPTFHNPTGYTATLERRLGLLELAEKYGIPVVEDVPYNDLWYDSAPPPTLLELGGPDLVIQLGTFSKTLCPALRVGWIIGSPKILKKTLHFKHIADTCSSGIMQRVAHQLCLDGFLDHNISRAREIYRVKRDVLLESFQQLDLQEVHCSRPDGGFFTWLQLPEGVSSQKLQKTALEQGVSIASAPIFFAEGEYDNACRLTISYPSAEEIRSGVSKLGNAILSNIQYL